ncbi:MAG: BON domain-containing protein [Pseudomonadota bacterium]|nr:BON domain-containing protein [Pseudomonadota bacterium]MED5228588.1 BON domain-containing protein [Pseudomonadota bacterium]|tara:strand:- start:5860 stop:6444 length:585 start_codon:yes stop_codon:yes gene_type:complete
MTPTRCTPLKSVCLGLLLLAGSILAGGCVPAVSLLAIDVVRDEREPRAYWQDNKAEMDIRYSIYRNKTISDTNVSVTIWNAVVLLTGEVPDQQAIDRILDIAKSHHYTRQVVNRIELAGRTNMASRINDSWLTGRVKTALVVSGTVDPTRFKVVTERANVYLMGLVTSAEATEAVMIVRSVPGVVRVIKVFEYF